MRTTARADDVATLVWDFADRIEQILVGLGEAAYESFGEHPGGLVPPRGLNDAAWLAALPGRIAAGDADTSPAAIAARSDAVGDRVDEGIATITGCVDRAGLRLSDSEPQIAARARALAVRARRLDRLAEAMEWLATVPGRPGVVRRA